ncbi:hypothetical protein PIB30_043651 [Stylosanthes scabra]|uniref:Uncharacterized protein n=1 Tax=Stylosanthes scabra TaxID=79078 RepID=A0ABU6YEI6_9FABA|nr:hypothetical protein [Stylosanthes scabra]
MRVGGGHNIQTGASIDAPFVATRSSSPPLRFNPIIKVVHEVKGVDSDVFEPTPPLKMSLNETCESTRGWGDPESIHISPEFKISVSKHHGVDSSSLESIL